MSIIKSVVAPTFSNKPFSMEVFDSTAEVVKVSDTRSITNSSFKNMKTYRYSMDFEGVEDYETAMELMKTGYKPVVEKLKEAGRKALIKGIGQKVKFVAGLEGFMPIVPLALKNIPQAMFNIEKQTIKNKVINVYYDMTCSACTSPEDITKSSCEMLSALLELEKQGYKFNVYTLISFYDSYRDTAGDVIMVKVKNSNTPLNIQRMSYTLTHPSFFRVIGFDWYSKFPKGIYRSGYGHALGYDFRGEQYQKGMRELVGDKNGVIFSCCHNLHSDKNEYMGVLTNATGV